ncbi:MAG TPA: YkvA family protein [Anaerolineaceae bacterium]
MSNQTPDRKFGLDNLGFVPELILRVRLVLRLMSDPRVTPLLKLLPVAAVLYWFIPTDLIPLIPLDDAAVLYVGGALFIELCPPEVVEEHMRALRAEGSMAQRPSGQESVIDGEFHDAGETQSGERYGP